MTLSLFIRNQEFHVCFGDVSRIYEPASARNLADSMPVFLADFLENVDFSLCRKVIFSSGPASFTASRIMNSVVKGLAVFRPDLEFFGISNFLTYMYIASRSRPDGCIAIPTMRGDYFCVEYCDGRLGSIKVADTLFQLVILDNNEIFENINLANIQHAVIDSEVFKLNPSFMSRSLDIDYGFTPEYKYQTTHS